MGATTAPGVSAAHARLLLGHRLGLGAKFLSHAQATALSAGERTLQEKIKGSANKRAAATEKRGGGGLPSKRPKAAQPVDDDLPASSSEDEEESRTSTFRCAYRRSHHGANNPATDAPLPLACTGPSSGGARRSRRGRTAPRPCGLMRLGHLSMAKGRRRGLLIDRAARPLAAAWARHCTRRRTISPRSRRRSREKPARRARRLGRRRRRRRHW